MLASMPRGASCVMFAAAWPMPSTVTAGAGMRPVRGTNPATGGSGWQIGIETLSRGSCIFVRSTTPTAKPGPIPCCGGWDTQAFGRFILLLVRDRCAGMSDPTVTWVGETCRIRWEPWKLLLRLSRMREAASGLVADSELWQDALGLLDFGTLNLHSRSGREGLIRKLEARVGKGDGMPNWASLLERALWMVATDFRNSVQSKPLEAVPPAPHDYLLDPILSRDHTNVLYGPWASGKSIFADLLALSIATGKALPGLAAPATSGPVVVCDWEAEWRDHAANVTALAAGLGWSFPTDRIHYLRMRGKPLTMAIQPIADLVHRTSAVLWIGDSLEPASVTPGLDGWHQASIAAFNTVATLPCTRLFIGQQSHDERTKTKGHGRLFGSVFGMYLTRNAWAIRRTDEDETSGQLTFALYHDKASFDRKRSPFALQVCFERPGLATVRRADLADAPDLLARASLPYQIQKILASLGQTDSGALAEHLNADEKIVARTLRRMKSRGSVIDFPGDGKRKLWGLKHGR